MGRTRTKTKKQTSKIASALVEEPSIQNGPTISSLLEKAQSLIVECNYDLALLFLRRILDRQPSHAEAKEMLGVVHLETGDLAAAKETFLTLLPPNPDAPPPPPSAYLYLAQLSDDDPMTALRYYQSAVDILIGQLKGKERAVNDGSSEDETELKTQVVRALVAMVEIWMDPSYDLCFDPSAEKSCEDLLDLALQIDPGNAEALQALASVRMSQQRPEDAKACLEKAWGVWKGMDLDDPRLPPIPIRLSLVKLFLELSLFTPALLVLHGVMAADDQEVEAWYLEGWCFFLMAEQAQENGGKLDELTWQELAQDSRDCLETCQLLHTNEGNPDLPLLDHVRELIEKLGNLGITPSPVVEGGGEDEEWEDDYEDDDGDVDMS